MSINVAYLSMNSLEEHECYDFLTFEPMQSLGYNVKEVSWRADTDWTSYEYVIIRSPWDYQDDPDLFIKVLNEIEQSSATLLNPVDIVNWNINKRYLRDLENRGVTIVPTFWGECANQSLLNTVFSDIDSNELIIKPAISAGAHDTHRISGNNIDSFINEHGHKFQNRLFLLQPFMDSVIDEGEYSLFYFNGHLSHCILKTPKTNDFRVQEEHGGQLKLILEPEPNLINCGKRVLEKINEKLLYARLDFVRYHETFALMEAELIEPSLYFNMDPESPAGFASAFDEFVKNQ